MKTYSEEQLLNKAASACSSSEHCISEIEEKLKRYGANEDAVERIICRLLKEGFIDEGRYAKAFTRDKYRFNKWGEIKIRMALKTKRVKDRDIEKAIDEIDRKEYMNNLAILIRAKQKDVKAENEYEKNGKLIRFALSKGYSIDEIQQILYK